MLPKPSASLALHLSTIASIVGLLIAFGDAVSLQAKEPELPLGCDQLGYLRQARLYQERGWSVGLNTELQSLKPIA